MSVMRSLVTTMREDLCSTSHPKSFSEWEGEHEGQGSEVVEMMTCLKVFIRFNIYINQTESEIDNLNIFLRQSLFECHLVVKVN